MSKLFDLKGKNIILTGGLGLLGKGFAKSLLEHGAKLIVLDVVAADEGKNVLRSFLDDRLIRKVKYLQADITDKEGLEKIRDLIARRLGGIDVLINNAALNPAVKKNAAVSDNAFENFSLEVWQKSLDVNLTGTMLCCQVFGSVMKEGSSIVNLASLYAVRAPDQRIYSNGFIKPVDYTVTKGAVIALTKYLAVYWAKKGIRVNSIAPGGVLADQDENFIKNYSNRVPMGRMCQAEELHGALIYLCSDASTYTTGVNLMVDGGATSW